MPRITPLLAYVTLLPAGLAAQEPHILRDAALPRAGEVWIEVFPGLLDWNDQYGPRGDREPVATDFEGPILSRLFPAIDDGLLADLNAGAGALGYDPLGAGDLSVGGLEFGTVQAEVFRALASLRVGVLDRVAVELAAPIVSTRVEPLFALDTAAATVARAAVALPDAASFLSSMDDALAALQARVSGGELSPEEEAQALALLEDSGAFLAALRIRVEEDRFLPLAETGAGGQMLARFGALSDGFTAFQISLPALGLRATPGAADLRALFTGEPLSGPFPGTSARSFQAGEVEAGVVVGLLDTSDDPGARLRLRTSVGAKLRIPTRDADAPAFGDPADPFALPIGDGQRDLELSVYQDAWLGSRLRVGAAGRVGIQAADELVVRIHPPDRPFALPETERVVRRDLGDYVQLRLAPQFLLNDVMSLGLEYGFWRKGADEFRLLQEEPDPVDAGALEVESAQTLHRLGFGVFYRPGEGTRRIGPERPEADGERSDAADGERPETGDGLPWRIGLTFQLALAGSGGRTPASRLLAATLRVPFRPF